MPHPMNSASERRPAWWMPALFGMWAAAIAVVRGVPMKALLAAPAAIAPVLWWSLQNPARWLALFFGAALLLPPLPIPLGDSGPHPCLLFAALGVLSGVLWLAPWRFVPTGLNAAFVTLFGVLLASVASAAVYSGGVAAAGSAARVLLFGISIYVFFYGAYGPGRQADAMRGARLLYWAATAAALFACVDFYFQFPAPAGYGPQFVWLDSGVYRRAQGLFYEASTLGNFCAFFLVMIAVAFTRPPEESPVSRKALAAGGAVFFAALVLSYSRASLVGCGATASACAWRASPCWRPPARCSPGGSSQRSPRCTGCGSPFPPSICSREPKACSPAAWRVGKRWPPGLPRIPGRPCSASVIRRCRTPTFWGARSWRTTCTSACW